MQTITITEEVFRTKTYFIFNCTNKEAEKFVKRKYDKKIIVPDDTDGTVLTFNKDGERTNRVVWLEYFDRRYDEDLSCLAHEVVHLAVRICEDKGIPIIANIQTGEVGDEPLAYLVDFFTKQFLEKYAISQKRKKRKKG